jgi:hypothetical protein
MALVEALTLQVGPAIAKAILKIWLKDRKFASDIASSLVDLIKSKTADVMAQRRANRQFAEIGENVAENLLPVFEMGGAHLDESSRTTVALAVSETLNRSPIDAELLAMRDLDPTKLMMACSHHPSVKRTGTPLRERTINMVISPSSRQDSASMSGFFKISSVGDGS